MPPPSSSIDPSTVPLKATFNPDGSHLNSITADSIIKTLKLEKHPEGGYYIQTDRDNSRVPNPYLIQPNGAPKSSADLLVESRSASTTIFYFLTPERPLGVLHRNRPMCIHTLHRGRGRYVVIHSDEVTRASHPSAYGVEDGESERVKWTGKARIETFIVGPNVEKGERLQWIVEGGTYKGSFLLSDEEGGSESDGLLISETVVPGFEWGDHDYMKPERLEALVTGEQRKELEWMLRREDM